MNIFGNNSITKQSEKGFIDKEEILKYVSERDIFELVFRFKPQEYDYVKSPFRKDRNPGCWFHIAPNGKWRFVDFGNSDKIGKVSMGNIDCFDAVQVYFKLNNLYETLCFIKKHLIDGKDLPEREKVEIAVSVEQKTDILFTPRNYLIEDKQFWFDRYQISKQNLIDDRVFPVIQFKVLNGKYGDYSVNTKSISYCYTDFDSGHKKIYRPYETKRFLTNCDQNDIGGIKFLSNSDKKLIITKSYKDYRVLKNQGLNVIWFQNEGMYPNLDILLPLCNRFDEIVIFFDNDESGIKASDKLVAIINSFFQNKARSIHFPINLLSEKISDPSDFIEKKGRQNLLSFLINQRLL